MNISIQQRASNLLRSIRPTNSLNFAGANKADVQKSYADHQSIRKNVDFVVAEMAEFKKNVGNYYKSLERAEEMLEANWRALQQKASREQADAIEPYIEAAGRLADSISALKTLTKSIGGNFGNLDTAAKQYEGQKAKVASGFNETIRYF